MTTSLALARSRSSFPDREAYPFASRRLRLQDGELHYVDEGEGEPVVFVHGTPTWSFEYRHLIAAFAKTHRSIALDHLGFGLSERPLGADYTPEAHSRRFTEFMEALDLPRATIVVHDFGGPIALPYAAAHPSRVARLVLFNTWMWSFDDDRPMQRKARFAAGAIGRFLYRHFNASLRLIMPSAYGDRRKLTAAIHHQYLEVFPDPDSREQVLHRLARSLLDSRDHYSRLFAVRESLHAIPTTILWGLADSAFPPAYLEKLKDALPNARAVALDGVGHWPHEEAPERVIEEIARALASGDSSARRLTPARESSPSIPRDSTRIRET